MRPQRILILIDGSNFYFKLKDIGLHKLLEFNFSLFCSDISNSGKLLYSTYYVGKVSKGKTPKSQSLQSNQQKLLASLKKHGVQYVLGYLLKSGGKYHEKGVDVRMAVDMLEAAYERKCEKILIISSDTDLEPAVRKCLKLNIEVEYIGFAHNPSVAMRRFCSSSRLLTKQELQKYIDHH